MKNNEEVLNKIVKMLYVLVTIAVVVLLIGVINASNIASLISA
ncbi:MAG TPA: hypothetical protein PLC53_00415 [Bacilli bacterium]|nr:hypothetical protein [Bacilli bacterium]